MKFSVDFLNASLGYQGWGEPYNGDTAEFISNDLIGTHRHAFEYSFVFKYNNKFYKAIYHIENYEEGEPFWQDEFTDNTVECIEVAPVEKVIIVYEPVDTNV